MLDSATFSGLDEWHRKLIQKFGWVILYKDNFEHRKTYEDKVNNYRKGIERWLLKANQKLEEKELQSDKKKDIMIMKEKMEILLKNVNEMLPIERYNELPINKIENKIINDKIKPMNGGMDDDSFIINYKDDIMN